MRRLLLAVLIPISVLSLNWAGSASAATGHASIGSLVPPTGYPPTGGDGAVFAFGSTYHGSVPGDPSIHLAAPIVGIAPDASGGGYWLVGSNGGVYSFGDARYHGSVPGSHAIHLGAPIVGMAATPDGGGYWLVGSDGGVFAFGDARYHGSVPGSHSIHLGAPIVGMAATHDGGGYWLVGSDGGVYSFGDARYHGSVPGSHSIHLAAPIVGIAPDATGGGYWLVGSNGGVYSFGDARYHGSVPGSRSIHLRAPIVGIATDATGGGYWLVGADGGVFAFGDARYHGSVPGNHSIHLTGPIVSFAAAPDGAGYWLAGGLASCLPASCIVQGATLALGSTGPAVLALQKRLIALGYWLGTADGTFGDSTQQAVYALQKAAGVGRDGIVGPTTWAALSEGVVPHPRSTAGYVIEVDLEDDLVMFVNNGKLEYTLNTSTGGGYLYSDGSGGTAIATTPTGLFHTYSEVDGLVVDYLGQLWMPKYFTGGFAIHGDSYVPPEPVSHGCVRVSDEAIEWIWASNLDPIGTTVWVY